MIERSQKYCKFRKSYEKSLPLYDCIQLFVVLPTRFDDVTGSIK